MKDIDVITRASKNYLPLTGGTLTGDLTIKNPSGAVSKLNVHRTIQGNDMQGSFDVYDTGIGIGGNGACALSTNNNTTNQQEACYVFAPRNLFAADVPAGVRPSLGADRFRFDKLWINDIDANGDIVAKKTSGGVSNISAHRTVGGRDMRATLNVYLHDNGVPALSGYNVTGGQLECTYVFGRTEFFADNNPVGNRPDLGRSAHRWRTAYTINALNTSDKNYKENIEYISNSKAKGVKEASAKDDKVTYEDMYNFYKNIEIAKYNYIDQEHSEFGFIAQDIAKDKVGSEIALDLEEGYMYSIGSYASTIAGALKHSINKIDALEKESEELKDRLDNVNSTGQNSTVTTLWNSVKDLQKENEELKNELAKMQSNAISALWSAVKELKRENAELKGKVK